MPKLLAYVSEGRNRPRPIVVQENATPASLANLRAFKCAKVPMVPVGGAGIVFAWQNPEVTQIIITRLILDVTTPATGVASMNVGVVANAGATADTIFDTADVGTAAAIFDNLLVAGAGTGTLLLVDENGGANDWITGQGSADTTGLVGNAYIIYQEV